MAFLPAWSCQFPFLTLSHVWSFSFIVISALITLASFLDMCSHLLISTASPSPWLFSLSS
jgi:hypothetical protein